MGFIPITYSFYSILAMTILMPYFSQNILKLAQTFSIGFQLEEYAG